ncbi:hypothetical protein T265_03221 [Opisthorchis viverrini]|uniref:Uncharacterized protein n=1 Tax=Opisthorchis viverrini TaxID=6198 RepID=A0A074ZSI7_OPIVI|nr:hypothetical protein T265_03221 [Opisthorchis viverrini]KER30388.1 hypothetical protein T265_03221 [Opisthorchis viverrini]
MRIGLSCNIAAEEMISTFDYLAIGKLWPSTHWSALEQPQADPWCRLCLVIRLTNTLDEPVKSCPGSLRPAHTHHASWTYERVVLTTSHSNAFGPSLREISEIETNVCVTVADTIMLCDRFVRLSKGNFAVKNISQQVIIIIDSMTSVFNTNASLP